MRDFDIVVEQMPEIIKVLKDGLSNSNFLIVREFLILPNERVVFGHSKNRFVFYENQYKDLRNKIDLLENYGYITDVAEGNTLIYRMNEDFVDLVLKYDDANKSTNKKNKIKKDDYIKSQSESDNQKVFVVHGRNLKVRDAMVKFLLAIGLEPIGWSEAVRMTGKGSPYIGEVLDKAFQKASAVVVLFTGDDLAKLDDRLIKEGENVEEVKSQARPNVLFEAGMAIGLHPDRTILVELGPLRGLSDIGGRHTIRINNTPELRKELSIRLETVGCAVERGDEWLTAGDFDSAVLEQDNLDNQLAKPSDNIRIDEIKEKLLLLLFKKNTSVEELSHEISKDKQIVLFYLNELKKDDRVYDLINERPELWKLRQEGRRYLIENKLVS
ncbi:MAG: nucleotide-binding protein [Nanoarchaeota archaeon]|nr:nucleotide-binding protein [Nanoarchaeota archaeon]